MKTKLFWSHLCSQGPSVIYENDICYSLKISPTLLQQDVVRKGVGPFVDDWCSHECSRGSVWRCPRSQVCIPPRILFAFWDLLSWSSRFNFCLHNQALPFTNDCCCLLWMVWTVISFNSMIVIYPTTIVPEASHPTEASNLSDTGCRRDWLQGRPPDGLGGLPPLRLLIWASLMSTICPMEWLLDVIRWPAWPPPCFLLPLKVDSSKQNNVYRVLLWRQQ